MLALKLTRDLSSQQKWQADSPFLRGMATSKSPSGRLALKNLVSDVTAATAADKQSVRGCGEASNFTGSFQSSGTEAST